MKIRAMIRFAKFAGIPITTGLVVLGLIFVQRGNADAPPSQIQLGNLQDYEGQLIRDKKNGKIYWIDGGRRRHIVSPPVLTRLFKAENVENFLDTGGALNGANVTDKNRLLTCREQGHPLFGRVYFFDNGRKRYITSPAAIEKYNFNGSKIKEIDCPVLETLSNGSAIN